MTATVVAMLSMTVVGLGIALAIDRSLRGPMLLGLAYLYGSGAVFAVMFALTLLRIRWNVFTVSVPLLAIVIVLALLPRRTANGQRRTKLHWLDIPTLVSIIGFGFFATAAPLWEWDFWAIWGLKARVFLGHGGIDWHFLESPWNTFVHADYPLLVPFNFDFVALLNNGWSDRWLGLLSVGWAAALVLIIRGLASDETSVVPAALVTLVITDLAASRYPGLAEGPLIAFGAAGLLCIRRGLQNDDSAAWRHGPILLGLAASTKNEGLALVVSVTIALLIVRRRAVLHLWPAIVIAAPWLILRATHYLPTDIAGGSALHRVFYRLHFAHEILLYLAAHLYEPWFWGSVLLGLIVAPSVARRREAFVLIATVTQLGFYIASYFATPHDARWHVATSWPRLTDQIAIPITYVVFLALAKYVAAMKDSPHAEARPVES
ncbi:MAG: glycosyltransferase family 39 protein [Acidobacteriota bacterium]|nr:glycosyltransferase family 39 protein [Acidobacteriota bacterium]